MDVAGWGFRMWPVKHGLAFSKHPRAPRAYQNFNQMAQAIIPCGACCGSFREFRQKVRPSRLTPGPGGAWEARATSEELRRASYDLHECVNDKLDAQHFEVQLGEIADGAGAAAPLIRALAPLLRGRRLPYEKLAKRQEHTTSIDLSSTWIMLCIMSLNYHPERAVHRAGFAAMVPIMAEVFGILGGTSDCAKRSEDVLGRVGGIPEWAMESSNALFAWVCALRARAMHPEMGPRCIASWIVGERCRLRSARAGNCSAISCK